MDDKSEFTASETVLEAIERRAEKLRKADRHDAASQVQAIADNLRAGIEP